MRKRFRLSVPILALVIFQPTTLAHVFDEVWESEHYDNLGFSMLMPSDSYLATNPSEHEDGWVTLRANMEGASFLGLAGPITKASPEVLDALRTKLSDWPTMSWEVVDEGRIRLGGSGFAHFEPESMVTLSLAVMA